METMIQVKDVSKTFVGKENTVEALKGINLEIHKGEIYGIIGMSGAGKSTLVRCLNFLEKPTEGTVIVEGKDLSSLPDKELRLVRTQIAMIFQHFNLLMQRTVLDNICFPLEIIGQKKKEAREKAKELLEEAGWDGSQTLRFYVNSGDNTFVNGAQVIVAQWAAVGVKAEITTVDLSTLMTVAGSTDYDIMAVQYTYAPVDPYPDVSWLLGGEGSWTGYYDDEVAAALDGTQQTSDVSEITGFYSTVDTKMQAEVPMFSVYVISAQGAVNNRVTGAEPSVYGFFNNVHNWDVTQ